jgi:hypothetical protein
MSPEDPSGTGDGGECWEELGGQLLWGYAWSFAPERKRAGSLVIVASAGARQEGGYDDHWQGGQKLAASRTEPIGPSGQGSMALCSHSGSLG